jgi:leucyl/phenylalanyl-tRNA--protein transferase
MERAYRELHRLGYAHSVEAWREGRLVGGLYGVALGGLYSGESMFAREPDASKVAFLWLVRQVAQWGIELVDCQVHTQHLARFGAVDMPRELYLERIAQLVVLPVPGLELAEVDELPGSARGARGFGSSRTA